MPLRIAWLGAAFLVAALFARCTTAPLYSFVVYSDSQPKSSSRLFQSPLEELGGLWERAIGSPTALRVPIYSFYLATTADCATPVPLIDYGNSPLTKEFYGKPTLFSGNPGASIYHCVVLKISDTLTFRPDAAAVGASSYCRSVDTEYLYDGYVSTQPDAGQWKSMTGDDVPATGTVASPSADVVTLFASTDPQQVISHRGVASAQVLTMSSPLQVPGEITLFANYLDTIVATSGVCALSGGLSFGLN